MKIGMGDYANKPPGSNLDNTTNRDILFRRIIPLCDPQLEFVMHILQIRRSGFSIDITVWEIDKLNLKNKPSI